MGWSLKAGKNLVSQGKEKKKIFLVREQSGQKCTWEKGKGRPRCEKMQVPEGQNRDFLVREHREIRLGGWGGTRV